MFKRLREKRKNKEQLDKMLSAISENRYMASTILLSQSKKEDGYYMPKTNCVATKPCVSTLLTTYGSVTLSLVVDRDTTAVNIREDKLFRNHAVCKHLLMNTDDCISKLSLI